VAQSRDFDAEPASPGHGEAWALQRIHPGDRTCRANQVLHTAAVNEVNAIAANRYYVPSVGNPLNPVTFVHKIHVPVFLAVSGPTSRPEATARTSPSTSPARA